MEKRMRPYSGSEPYVFVSYAHRNLTEVLPVIERLGRDGYRVWYDEGIDPGTEWDENIAVHVENCSFFLALLSEDYLESTNCKDELNFARDLQKPRVLVYLENVCLPSGMQMRLSRLQAIHKYAYEEEDFYEKLYAAHELDACLQKSFTTENRTESIYQTDGLDSCCTSKPVATDTAIPTAWDDNIKSLAHSLYSVLFAYRAAFQTGDQDGIIRESGRLQNYIRQAYGISERERYASPQQAEFAAEIVLQFNAYVKAYNIFASSPDKLSIQAQEAAQQAENEFRELVDIVVKLL